MDNNFTPEFTPEISVEPNNRKAGLMFGIVSVITGFISYLIAMIGYMIYIFAADQYTGSSYYSSEADLEAQCMVALALLAVAFVFAIPGIITGAIGIVTFIKKKSSPTKPIVTLILGIVGLALSLIGIFLVFLGVILIAAVLAAIGAI